VRIVPALLLAATIVSAKPVWIDTDPSVQQEGVHEVDDGFALVQAFRSPELQIRGVSVVFGNAPLDQAFPSAQEIMKR
jgi:inosine-uridine nucleoside N-ribohydrolase